MMFFNVNILNIIELYFKIIMMVKIKGRSPTYLFREMSRVPETL